MGEYLALAVFLTAFCLVAKRLTRSILTAPMVFLALGAALAWGGYLPRAATEANLHIVAEIALIVLLFLDAAQIDPKALRTHHNWPLRMLLIGLPLAFLLGSALAWLALPGWPLAAVALVAAILVPTDAALGQPVVSNPAIPARPRRALIVESGLNDGLALPLVLLMAALAAPAGTAPDAGWPVFALKQITLGPLIGVIVGCIGGWALIWAKDHGMTGRAHEGIGALALAAATYLAATLLGGNGFIAAFAGGLGFGAIVRGRCPFVYEFTESEGKLLSWTAFFLLGAVLVPDAIRHLSWPVALLILGSLFIIRPLAIWLSLLGSDASPLSRLFFGWFGPRGLATALFALLVVDRLAPELGEEVLHIAVNAVWISAILHGITAAPGAAWYARRAKENGPCAETEGIPEEGMRSLESKEA